MMFMAMLMKLMHITNQLPQKKMITMIMKKKNVKTVKIIQKPTKKHKKGITKSIEV